MDDRAAIYNLTQTFGGPGTLYSSVQTVTLKTGRIVETLRDYKFKKMIKLPRKMLWQVTPITQGVQKPFSFIKEQTPFLIMASDLPSGVVPANNDYIVYGGQGYTLDNVLDSSYEGLYLCMCTKMSGDIPRQIQTIYMSDTIYFAEGLVTS